LDGNRRRPVLTVDISITHLKRGRFTRKIHRKGNIGEQHSQKNHSY
jgi:hypothetical protein